MKNSHYLLLSLILITSCHGPEKEAQEEKTSDHSGKEISLQYCGSCHKYPEPDLLDRRSWNEYILPRMGHFLGIYDGIDRQTLIEKGIGGQEVEKAGIFPKEPLISRSDWEAIKEYYLSYAPDSLVTYNPKELPVYEGFKILLPNQRMSPPSTTMIRMTEHGLHIGDANSSSMAFFNPSLQLERIAKVREGAVWMSEFQEDILLTVMGSFSPTDAPTGFQLILSRKLTGNAQILIDSLKRPVHCSPADLNSDGRIDLVISEFGKWTGGLSWWEGVDDGTFKKHLLRNKPGAIKGYVKDIDGNGTQDIIALFGQGDEGIWAYLNRGDGSFMEKEILRFPPSYGSSYMDLMDLDGDGDLDIVYCAGDNADFGPILKPYHGIYVFMNDGDLNFKENLFYPLPGAYGARWLDVDLDGDLDIVGISFFPDFTNHPVDLIILQQNESGKFDARRIPLSEFGRWIVMDVGDLDQDGDQDIALGSLTMEVPHQPEYVQNWIRKGLPFLILENLSISK